MDLTPHNFIVRYRDNDERMKLSSLVMRLIQKHEISNFQIFEESAFLQNKIIYNKQNIVSGNNIDFDDLEEKFMLVFQD